MKFISIDVGIKNLSYCLFNKSEEADYFEILQWNNIDLTEKTDIKCSELDKDGTCNNEAKFTKNSKCYCLKHAKKNEFLIPVSEFKSSFLNKQKIQNLLLLADKYKIPYDKPCKKSDLIHLINEFSNTNCFEIIMKNNATKVDLVTIGKNIQHKFNILFEEHLDTIQTIIIENQIGPLANKMKTIQGMLAQYFIMKNNNIQIEFISSSNKLKDFIKKTDEKLDYKQRKQLGVKTCLEMVHNDFKYQKWYTFLQNHKKKDDLSDAFLQGLWYINNKIN